MTAVTFMLTQIMTKQLIEERRAANVDLTQTLSNSLWPRFRNFLLTSSDFTGDQLRAHPTTHHLAKEIAGLMRGLSIAKIKIYTLNGNTVFSTQASQMGDKKYTSSGFREAAKGRVTSELSHRSTFDAIERQIFDVDVISSYIPIRNEFGEIEGVFEIYDNVTPTLEKAALRRNLTIAYVGLLFVLLYFSLLLIVHRAAKIMREQRFLIEAHRGIYT